MTNKIPDDVMEAAFDIVGIIREHKNCEEEYNTFQIRYREAIDIVAHALLSERESATKAERERCDCKFPLGSLVTKTKGSSWTGHVVGFYSTNLTPIGYAVESINEPGSVQIYPESALAAAIRKGDGE